MARFTLPRIKKMTPQDIGELLKDKKEAQNFLRSARKAVEKRIEQFSKPGSHTWSPAVEKISDYSQKQISRMKKTEIGAELARIQDFFNSKTSTVKGAREVAREQDAAIFGVDSTGKPNRRMTYQQRTKFWEAYDKFQETYAITAALLGSSRFQEVLGQMSSVWASKNVDEIGADALQRIEDFIQDNELNTQTIRWGDNNAIYSGPWNGDSGQTSSRGGRR